MMCNASYYRASLTIIGMRRNYHHKFHTTHATGVMFYRVIRRGRLVTRGRRQVTYGEWPATPWGEFWHLLCIRINVLSYARTPMQIAKWRWNQRLSFYSGSCSS